MRLKISKVIAGFLKWAEHTLEPSTVVAYRYQLEKFARSLKIQNADRLAPAHLSAWAKSWHEAQAVIRAFNWAVNEANLLKKNPFAGVRKPRRGQRRRIITPTAMAQLLRASSAAGRQFMLALRETLARPQEIRLARFEDLQTDDLSADLDAALADGRALFVMWEFKDVDRRRDQSRPRVLLISRRLGRLILRVKARSGRTVGPIFVNSRGDAWTRNAVRCLMRRLRRRLAIPADTRGENVVAYTFRHSLATLAASRGVTDRTLADLLGHVETRTTSRYLHLQCAHLRAAAAKVSVRQSRTGA